MTHDSTHTPAVGGAAAVKVALLASRDLRPNERLVLVAIAAHTNHDGDARPSVATIAEYAGVSTRTVQRALAKLVALRRVAVRQVANVATRVYRLVTGQPAVAGGDNHGQGVTNGGPGGDTPSVSPEVGKTKEKNYRAGARDWRRFIPKSKNPNPNRSVSRTGTRSGGVPLCRSPTGRSNAPATGVTLGAIAARARSEALAGGR